MMLLGFWLAVGIVGGALMVLSAWGLIIGLTAMCRGWEFQRCSHCGWPGLAPHARLHAQGCPVHHPEQHFHELRTWMHGIGLGHN